MPDAQRSSTITSDQARDDDQRSLAGHAEQLTYIRRRLPAWYRQTARDLPWRRTRDPYAIWVSEIMLQQTQVSTVVDYFHRFLAAFPDIAALAAADEAAVLRLWEGLGYYRRARSMHAAARKIVEKYDGQFPQQLDHVRALPGIGRYTAGAVLSFAFNHRLPILEANTRRLYARLTLLTDDPTGTAAERQLWSYAEHLLPHRNVAEFNQALMELGARICKPQQPDCPSCPVRAACPTARRGWQERIPPVTRKIKFTDVTELAVVVRHQGKVLMRQCGSDERWAGLWDFPRFDVTNIAGEQLPAVAQQHVHKLTGVRITLGRHLVTLRHGVTRYRIQLLCHEAQRIGGRVRGGQWLRPAQLHELPLSVTGRKIAQRLAG